MKMRHFLVDIPHLLLAAFGLAASLAIAGVSIASDPIPNPNASYPPDHPTNQVADSFTELLREAIPREYERKKDWGQTKRIPVGIQNTGHGLRLRIRKREKEVNHGIWKHYRISMIHPEENLQVQIEKLRRLGAGRIGLTVTVSAKVHGWAGVKVYHQGVHVISLTAEGDTRFNLSMDCEVGMRFEPASVFIGFIIDPVVTNAKLRLEDFHLERVGELHGPLVHELGDGLRHLMEDELEPAKLTQKLNRAIDKKRDRLRFSPDQVFSIHPDNRPNENSPDAKDQ